MDSYIAKFERDGDGILAIFADIPEAISGGADLDEAASNAAEALELALLTYAGEGTPIPPASPPPRERGEYRAVPVAAAVAAKIAFILAFKEAGITRVALASRLGKAETEVRRMLDPYHQTKLPAIEAGLKALGKRLVVTVAEAA